MQTDAPIAEAVRKPSRRVAKATSRALAKPIKTAVSLSPETMRRLALYAVMTDRTQSQVVAELIDLHCRRFVVQDRDRSANLADQATHEVSAAA